MKKPPIVLLTDFGHQDPYVGIMKGVIASRAPKARVIDLCHGIEPQDVSAAALALRASTDYFPPAIFVVVVDPGVGSSRRIILARTKKHAFLAPDNGVLSWLGERILERRSVTNEKLFLDPVSGTFHGRDKFAPAAAALWSGARGESFGPRISDPVELPFPRSGCILAFDRFGNAITSIPSSSVGRKSVVHKGRSLGSLKTHYAQSARGVRLAVAGSSGLVELSVREGDYRALTKARKGDPVHVRN